ncbi:hypothetical protein D3C72_1558250 [compost metagenome]
MRRRVLDGQCGGDGNDATEAEPADESQDAEDGGRRRVGRAQHGQREQENAEQQHPATADHLAQRADQEGAKEHADQGIAAEGTEFQRRQVPVAVVGECGQYRAHDADVIAFKKNRKEAYEKYGIGRARIGAPRLGAASWGHCLSPDGWRIRYWSNRQGISAARSSPRALFVPHSLGINI